MRELSENSPYYIPKYRYLELKYYCLQYWGWKHAYDELSKADFGSNRVGNYIVSSDIPDPTLKKALALSIYDKKIKVIENAAQETDEEMAYWIIQGVTKGYKYENLRFAGIPCCRNSYYELYRRFFWILSQYRD